VPVLPGIYYLFQQEKAKLIYNLPNMMILLSPAKTMTGITKVKVPEMTIPSFQQEANEIILQMSQYSVTELAHMLKLNPKLAAEIYHRIRNFHSEDTPALPSILAYTGIVFQKINPRDFTKEDFLYVQEHMRFSSACYGLLRPLDMIKPYRMEFDLSLPELGEENMFNFWRPKITDLLIKEVKADDNILINVASSEIQSSFYWKQVQKEVRVITPDFKVWKNGKLKTIVIYAKMMRGQMSRFIIKERITDPEELKAFTWEGFMYNDDLSEGDNWVFTQL